MPNLKLIKNPGYVYDLIFLFYYKFNAEIMKDLYGASDESMEYFAEQCKLFDPIPDDLYIFFSRNNSRPCFFSVNYFNNYGSILATEYDLAFLLKELDDRSLFVRNVIKHYFLELDDEDVDKCVGSNKYLFEIIKKSDYDDKLKVRLYEFFADPDSYIRLLQRELMAKDVQLASYYERNYSKILDAYNELSYEAFMEKHAFFEQGVSAERNRDNVYFSFCLLNKDLLRSNYSRNATLYIIGTDYIVTMEQAKKKRTEIIPDRFGSAISEASRVNMLEVILQKGQCTCKELGEALGIPASTAYHHVNVLEKCGAVETRIVKKSMFYTINRKYFSKVMEYFQKFADEQK